MRTLSVLLLAAFGLCAARPSVLAQTVKKKPKTRVAVLEFRGGTTGASEIGMRLSARLRELTSLSVVDPRDARRVAGEDVDKKVAGCAGDAGCIARLGRRLDVDKVLLVGVNEFGDLILALQIIDVKTRQASSRFADSLPRDAEPTDEQLEGYLKRLFPPQVFKRFGVLQISSNVEGAVVYVDGKKRGTTPMPDLVVEAPRKLAIRAEKKGYQEFVASVQLPPEGVMEVPLLLQPLREAWYEKWWVWAAGGAAVTVIAVGALLIFSPEADRVDVIVDVPPPSDPAMMRLSF